MLRLKGFVKILYSISDDRCHAYNPDDKMPVDKTKVLLGLDKYIAFKEPLDLDLYTTVLASTGDIDALTAKKVLRIAIADYNRLSVTMECDPEDYTIAGKKLRAPRQSKTPGPSTPSSQQGTRQSPMSSSRKNSSGGRSKSNGSSSGSAKKSAGKAVRKKRMSVLVRRKRRGSDDDSDEDDDDGNDDDEFDDSNSEDSDYSA